MQTELFTCAGACLSSPVAALSPAQQTALDGVLDSLAAGDLAVLRGRPGSGKTAILGAVHARLGGAFIGASEFMQALSRERGLVEEAFLDVVMSALQRHRLAIVDDLHLIVNVVESCDYPRGNLLDIALTSLLSEARAQGKKLLFALGDNPPQPLRRRAYSWRIAEFGPADYETICLSYLSPDAVANLDFHAIQRFAPMLNAHQLRNACVWLRSQHGLDTDRFVEYLRSQDLTSNVEIEEVDKVDWSDLKGIDEVIQELEAKIALPFENDALAAELSLKPKRGVLLAGPPGTGKTTIGRALAHRLKSKFFLIDGTMIAGSSEFYSKVDEVFESARRNAPSIIFIDDADVIFDSQKERGLCRYLLTMLDGLESASSGRICVMMTAMEPANLPVAVLRSGRVELWLEMRLPDEEARSIILRGQLSPLPPPLGNTEVSVLAAASHGLTGADIKSVVEDGKLLYARDRASGRPLRSAEDYFLEAIATVRKNRRSYLRSKPSPLMETVKIGYRIE